MITYLLNSKEISEPVVFEYNSNGLLTAFKSEGLTTKQLNWVYGNFPVDVKSIEILQKQGLKFTKVQKEITFDMFYARHAKYYGRSVGRAEAEPVWKRMSKANHWAAYEYLHTHYVACKNDGISMKQPPSYLRKAPWND